MKDGSGLKIEQNIPKEQENDINYQASSPQKVIHLEEVGKDIQSNTQMINEKVLQYIYQANEQIKINEVCLQTQQEQDNCMSNKKQKKEAIEHQKNSKTMRENKEDSNNYYEYENLKNNGSSQRFWNQQIKQDREKDSENKYEINSRTTLNKNSQGKRDHNKVDIDNNKDRNDGNQKQIKNFNSYKQQLQNNANQNLVSTNLHKAWPSCGFNIFGRKLSINLRKVQYFNAKILVVPYRNLDLDYQPGQYILSSNADYRLKLKAKGQSLQKGGSIYVQKASKLGKYEALLFLRINQSNKEQSLQAGLTYFMKIVSNLQREKILDTLVFPLSQDLCEPCKIIQIFVKCLDLFTTIKQVHITTHDPSIYHKCMKDYSRYVKRMLEENELSFD